MRLKRISLFAALALLVAAGCSTNRNALHPLRNDNDRVAAPPRHDHEYAPSPEYQDDDFQNPSRATGPQEPLPAPPAFGVSRVKSVSWLKDLGGKLNRKSDTAVANCSDETLVGQCSPLDNCGSESACEPQVRVERFKEQACEKVAPKHVCAITRLRKSVGRILHKPKPISCTDDCGLQDADACGTPATTEFQNIQHNYIQHKQSCGERPEQSGCGTQEIPRSRVNQNLRPSLHPECKKECLAEPLLETSAEQSAPRLPAPTENGRAKFSDQEFPIDTPAGELEPPLPNAPILQDITAPSTQIVEPPVWPRLRAGNMMTPVSHSATSSEGSATNGGKNPGLPQVQPMLRK